MERCMSRLIRIFYKQGSRLPEYGGIGSLK